ncbi:SpoIIE family protein phosphatase [Streptomyces sp. URMC 129]|uniref:SpoIIE family protein phosphatase n=1 Tax=Streptomyces sp. URMC 129 TaxID=3423407 RepID=UPI003F1A44B5
MSPSPHPRQVSTQVRIDHHSAVHVASVAARGLARDCGLTGALPEKAAVLASELATNLDKHARDGVVYLQPLALGEGLDITAADRGPGMSELERCFADGYTTSGTLGAGLGAVRRIATDFTIRTQPGDGTVVSARLARPQDLTAARAPVGAVCLPLEGEDASGDACAVTETDTGRTAVVVDALGHGPPAADAARAAMTAFAHDPGRPLPVLMAALHRALRRTRGAAVALLRLSPGRLDYCGTGNVRLALVTSDRVRTGPSGPPGIVGFNMPEPTVHSLDLAPQETCVLHSDGIDPGWARHARPFLLRPHENRAMTTTDSRRFRAQADLRHAVRQLARTHRLPVDLRARLVVSVTAVAGSAFAAGGAVHLETSVRRADNGHPGLLAVVCRPLGHAGRPESAELPLPAELTEDGGAVWRVPLPPRPAGGGAAPGLLDTSPGSESEALEQELQQAMARADALAADHRRLKHELAETNSGVLALYVQLEERDERLRRAHGKTLRELEDALRPPPLDIDGLELAVHYAPAGTDAPTGGDLYDWFRLPDGTVHITVVDALGHGVTSTRSALNVTHAVRTLALEGHRLESIIARADEVMRPFDRDVMATVQLARITPATGELLLANGSHPPGLLVRASGGHEYLEVKGRGVGFPLPGSERLLRTTMEPGDLLVLYTDGLTESRRDPLEGEARLIRAARRHAGLPITDVPRAIAREMHTVILHPDDTLALALRLLPRQDSRERVTT